MAKATEPVTTNLSRRSASALRHRLVNERSRSREPLPALLPHEATGHSGLDTKKDQPKLDPIAVTIQQACALSGLSHVTIYRLINAGKLHSVKIGRRRLVTYASLRGLLEAA
jgi:excisionase family DNA binding protein